MKEREDGAVIETRISATRVKTKPKYDAAAAELLEKCRAFYQDPENEQAFQKWKEERGAK